MKIEKILLAVLLFVVGYIVFSDLGSYPIRLWDEAIYANNAIDMYLYGDWWNVKKLGVENLTNTKPPLLLWFQAMFIYIVGINEWAIRLPTAFFVLATVLLIYRFGKNVLDSAWIGFYSGLVLLTSYGYMSLHIAKTGDLDAALAFWTTAYTLFFIELLIKQNISDKKIIYFAIMIFLAFMTKGVAGLFLIPSILFLALLPRNIKYVFSQKKLYLAAVTVVLLIVGYYFLRDMTTTGYMAKVWSSELVRYSNNVMSFHSQPFWFYGGLLVAPCFYPYIYILPAYFLGVFSLKSTIRLTSLYVAAVTVVLFLFLSSSTTKIWCYLAVLYPFLSILVGLTIFMVFDFFLKRIKQNDILKNTILGLLSLVFIYPYVNQQGEFAWINSNPAEMEYEGFYLKSLKKKLPDLKEFTVYKEVAHIGAKEDWMSLYDQVFFYKRVYEHEYAYKILVKDQPSFIKGECVLVSQPNLKEKISKKYNYKLLDSSKMGSALVILSKK